MVQDLPCQIIRCGQDPQHSVENMDDIVHGRTRSQMNHGPQRVLLQPMSCELVLSNGLQSHISHHHQSLQRQELLQVTSPSTCPKPWQSNAPWSFLEPYLATSLHHGNTTNEPYESKACRCCCHQNHSKQLI